jgi:hypothetical protein
MMNEAKFGLVEPFEIDDGCLKGITPEYAFALGVEWQMFREQLQTGKPFKILCLPENRARFVAMAERHRRFVEDRQTACVDWSEIWVGDLISCAPPAPESK